MKQFDLEKAIAGKPVVTRDGEPVRIICWDRNKTDYPIVALVGDKEVISSFTTNGSFFHGKQDPNDLFMAIEKKEGWVNLYITKDGFAEVDAVIYKSDEIALLNKDIGNCYISTVKIEWEE